MSARDHVIQLVNELEATAESMDLDEPSAILVTDPETGTKTVTAPYANGYAAFSAMEKLREKGGFPPGCDFEVVPCYPPRGEWA
jgi:hypothetical protein